MERLYSSKEASEILGLPVTKIRRLCQSQQIGCLLIGGRLLFRKSVLDSFLSEPKPERIPGYTEYTLTRNINRKVRIRLMARIKQHGKFPFKAVPFKKGRIPQMDVVSFGNGFYSPLENTTRYYLRYTDLNGNRKYEPAGTDLADAVYYLKRKQLAFEAAYIGASHLVVA